MGIIKKRNSIILLLCICLIQGVLGQEIVPLIDIEFVRKDIISQGGYMFPEEHIKNIEPEKFNVFYLDEFCLVHIAYKNTDTHSSEKFSHIVIYSLKDKTWIYQNSIPYYYNLKMLNAKMKFFFTDNLFCGMNGSCNRLVEISRFDGHDLPSLVKYEGYDNTLFFDRLLVFDEKNEVLDAIGDTICNDFIISEININEKGLNSYVLTQKVVVLKGVISDTLQTIDNQYNNKIIYKP